tara:strand:- start:219 stop:929 length:711 start_codon:yes stop_codon:yes gene_type:complete
MKLSYILQNLTYGELKQLGVGGFDNGSVKAENYIEVIGHINLALQNLYTRFPINEKEILLKTDGTKFSYRLHSDFNISANSSTGYLLDTTELPFENDILRIEGVYNEIGISLPINDSNSQDSVFIPSYDTIQIPYATLGQKFAVVYRASHKLIQVPVEVSNLDLDQDVYIPESLLEALLVYVSYRIQKGTGGEAGISLAFATKKHYEALCFELETRNVFNPSGNIVNIKPQLGGWV